MTGADLQLTTRYLLQEKLSVDSLSLLFVACCIDIDARPWDFQAEEGTLRANIEAFNRRRYDKPQDAAFAPVDNCLQSVLGQQLELPEDFQDTYELWLEREVFSQPIRWEELLRYQ